MDIVKLKTKTRKSKVEYGYAASESVQAELERKNYRNLAYVYFNIAWITFTDDILDEARIYEKYRIQKPGRDEEMYERWKCGRTLARAHGDKLKANAMIKANRKRAARRDLRAAEAAEYRSKLQLEAANHGHIKTS